MRIQYLYVLISNIVKCRFKNQSEMKTELKGNGKSLRIKYRYGYGTVCKNVHECEQLLYE
jgi:hypothetical protein